MLLVPALVVSAITYQWTWQARPDAAALERCLGEMEAVAKARPDAVEAKVYPAGTRLPAIVIKDKLDPAPNDFMFPGDHVPGYNALSVESRKYQAMIGAALLLASDCFDDRTLRISSDADWMTEWAAARALYAEVTHRQPSIPLGTAPPQQEYEEDDPDPITTRLMGMLPIALGLMWLMSRTSSRGMNWGSYYLIYLAAPAVIALAVKSPWLLLVVPIAWIGRKWLPDPYLWLRRMNRMSRLKRTMLTNPYDTQTAVELAGLYLEQRRPQRALPLLDRALEREPRSAELLHYKGLCLLGLGDYGAAHRSFTTASELQPKLRYGEPYLRAADSLVAQKKHKDALPLLEHFVQMNHSSVEGLYKLSRVRWKNGDDKGGNEARSRARSLYRELPPFARKSQLGWYVRSWIA